MLPLQVRCLIASVLVVTWAMAAPCAAQFYPKVDYYESSVNLLKDAVSGERPGTASLVGSIASLQDPALLPLFESMMQSSQPATRIYGILGSGLAKGGKSVDAAAVVALETAEERGVAVRESNATGLLRGTPLELILASPDLHPATILTLVGEQDRRGATWDPALIRSIAAHEDPAMAGIASLLLLSKGDAEPWQTFLERWSKMPEPMRSDVVRSMAEGSVVFEIEQAIPPVLAMANTAGVSDDSQLAAVGAALTLSPAAGLQAWQDRVAARRTQPQLVRAGLQLLAADEKSVPASAFEQIRNGSAVLDAIANAGKALRAPGDPSGALIGLLQAGHPVSGEWAMLRARTLPPEQAAKVWKFILAATEAAAPEDRPSPILVSLAIRELMRTDPAAVRALVDRCKNNPGLAVALLSGVYDSGAPEGADIARSLRGNLPRAGESLACMILARANAPLTDDDLDVLGRAAAGGGDLESMRAAQAAWFFIKRRDKTADAILRISGAPAASGKPSS